MKDDARLRKIQTRQIAEQKHFLPIYFCNFQTEKNTDDNIEEIDRLRKEISQLKEQIYELERKAKQENRRNTEIRLAEQKIHEEEIQFLKKTNHQLKVSDLPRID